jgi:hypothetical protein
MKQDELKTNEKTVSAWDPPILEEIDVALLTQFGSTGHTDGILTSS